VTEEIHLIFLQKEYLNPAKVQVMVIPTESPEYKRRIWTRSLSWISNIDEGYTLEHLTIEMEVQQNSTYPD